MKKQKDKTAAEPCSASDCCKPASCLIRLEVQPLGRYVQLGYVPASYIVGKPVCAHHFERTKIADLMTDEMRAGVTNYFLAQDRRPDFSAVTMAPVVLGSREHVLYMDRMRAAGVA